MQQSKAPVKKDTTIGATHRRGCQQRGDGGGSTTGRTKVSTRVSGPGTLARSDDLPAFRSFPLPSGAEVAGRRKNRKHWEREAKAIAQEVGVVTLEFHHTGTWGKAWPTERRILVPYPTSRRRLVIGAYQAAEVALEGVCWPAFVMEFARWHYAFALVRRQGVAVPRRCYHDAEVGIGYELYRTKKSSC